MALVLGDILSGLVPLAEGAEQGIAKRKELERQARRDLLAQRLQEAQIGHLNAETTRLQTPAAPKPTRIDPLSDEGIKRAAERARLLAITRPPRVTPTKPPTATERETNAAARTALDLVRKMRAGHAADPTKSQLPLGSALLRGVGRLPVVGDALSGLTDPAAQQFMTPGQAEYQQQADQLLHLASSVLPKGGRSMALLKNLRASFTSPALAKNPEAAQAALAELENQLTEVLGESPTPGAHPATPVPATPKGPAYNKKFWP